jgi:hypothetical protein
MSSQKIPQRIHPFKLASIEHDRSEDERAGDRMLRFLPTRFLPDAILLLLALGAVSPLSGETVLIAVRESLNGESCPLPFSAKEGISESLFDKGHIMFDVSDSDPVPSPAELEDMAMKGGAGFVLEAVVEFRESRLEEDRVRVDASARYSVSEASTGKIRKKGEFTATNAGRERGVDRTALGMEMGKTVAAEIEDVLKERAFSP